MNASFYTVWYTIQASIPSIFAACGYNRLLISVAFLPGGASTVVSVFVTGRVIDHNYERAAQEIGHTIDRTAGEDMDVFPIEQTRSRGGWGF